MEYVLVVKGQKKIFFKFETSSSHPNEDACQTVGNSGLDLRIQFQAGGTDMEINAHYSD